MNDKHEMLQSPIQANDPRGKFIRELAVICWDEATMANRAVLSCVDETCRRVMGNDVAFGGKTVILLGDFRQTGPVIRGGSRTEIVDASIKSSPLWPSFQIFRLIHAVRNAEDLPFSQWADDVGDGFSTDVAINDMLPIVYDRQALIDFVFPTQVLANPDACVNRSILAPTNVQINEYNDAIIRKINGHERLYLAADTVKESDETGFISPDSTLDYVARQTPTGLDSPITISLSKQTLFSVSSATSPLNSSWLKMFELSPTLAQE